VGRLALVAIAAIETVVGAERDIDLLVGVAVEISRKEGAGDSLLANSAHRLGHVGAAMCYQLVIMIRPRTAPDTVQIL
jgi:hypothetical protein